MEVLWAPANLTKKACGLPQGSSSPRETSDSVHYTRNLSTLGRHILTPSQKRTNSGKGAREALHEFAILRESLESVHSLSKLERKAPVLGEVSSRFRSSFHGSTAELGTAVTRACEAVQAGHGRFGGEIIIFQCEQPCTIASPRVRVRDNCSLREKKPVNVSRWGKNPLRGTRICSVENGVASEVVLEAPPTTMPSHTPGAVGSHSSKYKDSLALHKTDHSKKHAGAHTLFASQNSVLGTQELTQVSPFRPVPLVECFEVEGGSTLSGEVQIAGAKNSALAVLAGTICSEGQVCLKMIPDLHDIHRMIQVLQSTGVKVQRTSAGILVDASDLRSVQPCEEAVRKLRASFFVIGPLLGRKGEAIVPLPGGCDIGARPIDLHVRGLESLGAKIEIRQGKVHARVRNGRSLVGSSFRLDYPSVGATETLMMAAALADGHTTLSNVAQEPEVVDLADFLISCGANIQGAGTNTLYITGRRKLHGTEYQIIPDRIEAGTFLIAAAITRSTIALSPVVPEHLSSVIAKLRTIGCRIQQPRWNSLRINCTQVLRNCTVRTLPYPGFPTDLQPQLMSLLTTCHGQSVLEETVFEGRMRHVVELQKLGAQVKVIENVAIINGKEQGSSLYGAPVSATDLRAGAALVLAGMAAEGATYIQGVSHIDRGYEKLDQKLRLLGASIQRLPCLPSEMML